LWVGSWPLFVLIGATVLVVRWQGDSWLTTLGKVTALLGGVLLVVALLGDLLLATVGPLVFRKAFGKTAGTAALVIALAALAVVMILPLTGWLRGAFPVMVVLGPLLVVQYGYWLRVTGQERTTAAYLAADPLIRNADDRGGYLDG